MPVDVFDQAELLGADQVWLLDLTYAGRVWRLSSEVIDVSESGKTVLPYSGGLSDVQWVETVGGFSTEPQVVSVSFEALLPEGADVAELVQAGHDLSAATGELSLLIKGQDYANRRRVLVGQVVSPVYGALGEPLKFTLETAPYEDRSALVDSGAVVSLRTWPDSLEAHRGRAYPVIFGIPAVTSTDLAASPALLVDTTSTGRLLVAGHEVKASSVKIRDLATEGAGWRSLSIVHMDDGAGRKVATVVLPASGDAVLNTSGNYVVSWAGSSGGMYNRDRSGVMTSAGEIMEWALGRSTLQVDRGRTAAALERLRGFQFAGYVDDLESSTWDWLRSNVLPLLPIDIKQGPEGLYPVVYDWRATAGSVVASLDADRLDVHRISQVEYRSTRHGQVSNEIRLSYGLDIDSNQASRTAVLHGDPDAGTAVDFYLSRACHLSRIRHDRLRPFVHTLNSDLVYAPETAGRSVSWLGSARALASRRISYEAGPEWGWLRPGDPVMLTDSDLHLSDQVCLVVSVDESGGAVVGLELETIEDGSR